MKWAVPAVVRSALLTWLDWVSDCRHLNFQLVSVLRWNSSSSLLSSTIQCVLQSICPSAARRREEFLLLSHTFLCCECWAEQRLVSVAVFQTSLGFLTVILGHISASSDEIVDMTSYSRCVQVTLVGTRWRFNFSTQKIQRFFLKLCIDKMNVTKECASLCFCFFSVFIQFMKVM